jgi:hypothetical protein
MDPMDPMDKYLMIAKYLSIGSIFFYISKYLPLDPSFFYIGKVQSVKFSQSVSQSSQINKVSQ